MYIQPVGLSRLELALVLDVLGSPGWKCLVLGMGLLVRIWSIVMYCLIHSSLEYYEYLPVRLKPLTYYANLSL